ncbi:hypothetical protein [Echinicola sp. 20G]|uniref:hypothetical protein n=1 Tax=Echinicola sp. 20G TaxID=2781961 RepID=UPI00191079B2|nr:hypothetical protein [Echinicola sp. 20G]
MNEGNINLKILNDESIFLEIHQLKNQFVNLFSQLANQITESELTAFDKHQIGTKISKGNELEHCPYQVLDLVRNFHKEEGFNIRFLNWWGHGLYVLVYFGAKNIPSSRVYDNYIQGNYQICQTGSPWDYKGIVKSKRLTNDLDYKALPSHLSKMKHLQFIKKIDYKPDLKQLSAVLLKEWNSLKNFHFIE